MMRSRRVRIAVISVLSGTVVTTVLAVKAVGFGMDTLFPLMVGAVAAMGGGILALPIAFRIRRAMYGDEEEKE